MQPDLPKLGQLLKTRREDLGIRRSEVARSVGVSPSYIATLEEAKPRGAKKTPSRPTLGVVAAWARALSMNNQTTAEALQLAGYSAAISESRTEPSPDLVQPHLAPEILLGDMRIVLELASRHPHGRREMALLWDFMGLLKFRLEHE